MKWDLPPPTIDWHLDSACRANYKRNVRARVEDPVGPIAFPRAGWAWKFYIPLASSAIEGRIES